MKFEKVAVEYTIDEIRNAAEVDLIKTLEEMLSDAARKEREVWAQMSIAQRRHHVKSLIGVLLPLNFEITDDMLRYP